jgi:hypothetical protein
MIFGGFGGAYSVRKSKQELFPGAVSKPVGSFFQIVDVFLKNSIYA